MWSDIKLWRVLLPFFCLYHVSLSHQLYIKLAWSIFTSILWLALHLEICGWFAQRSYCSWCITQWTYFFFSWHTVMKLSNIEAESRVITNHAMCSAPYKRFSSESYFVTLSYFQVCMVIVVVYWLMRSKGLFGFFLVHEVHFNGKLNTLLCMQSYSKPKERVCQVKI